MPGSQAQYLSGVKTFLCKKFPKDPYFKDPSTYKEFYKRLRIRSRVDAIKRGKSPEDKTEGLHADLLRRINHELISQNRFYDRAVLNALYHEVGRSSEVALWTWESTKWNSCQEEQLESDWREVKTSKNGLTTWHCHANSFTIDSFHSMAAYLITLDGTFERSSGSNSNSEASYVFPEFSDLANGGAAAKVSRVLKGLIGKVDGLTEDPTGHSLCVGSADDMVYHNNFNLFAALSRGNWDFSGECTIFTYWTMKLFVGMAGKMLSGWRDPNQKLCSRLPSTASILRPQTLVLQYQQN